MLIERKRKMSIFADISKGRFGAAPPADPAGYNECVATWKDQGYSTDSDMIKGMWDDAKGAYLKACERYKPGDKKISITLPGRDVSSNGFELNGIDVFFKKGLSVGLEMKFGIEKGKRARLEQATYKFSQPVMGAANFVLNLNFRDVVNGVLGILNEEDVIRIIGKVSIKPFDKKKTGLAVKPMLIAFDRMTVYPSLRKDGHRLFTTISSEKYYNKRGWGVYTFGSSEKDCTAANLKGLTPSTFLGNGFGGDGSKGECRSKEIGPRFGRPIVKWLLGTKKWATLYDKFIAGEQDSGPAFVSLMNAVFGSGLSGGTGSWDALAKEEDLLGSGFMIWEKNRK